MGSSNHARNSVTALHWLLWQSNDTEPHIELADTDTFKHYPPHHVTPFLVYFVWGHSAHTSSLRPF